MHIVAIFSFTSIVSIHCRAPYLSLWRLACEFGNGVVQYLSGWYIRADVMYIAVYSVITHVGALVTLFRVTDVSYLMGQQIYIPKTSVKSEKQARMVKRSVPLDVNGSTAASIPTGPP